MKRAELRSLWTIGLFVTTRLLAGPAATLLLLSLVFAWSPAVAEPKANAESYATARNPERLVLDAREVGRGIMTSNMVIPVRPGPFTFVYPKWIPGRHTPSGPLDSVSEIKVLANGQALTWRRDGEDMYAFHVDVPHGVDALEVQFTVLVNSPNPSATPNLAVVDWSQMLFYQKDTRTDRVYFKPSILLPEGWSYGTALPGAQQVGQRVDMAEVTLEMLVDSPLDCGRYSKHIELWREGASYHMLDVFADAPQDLDFPMELVAKYKRLAPEALSLYGSRHWDVYHSLLVLSDKIGFWGLEHHQSSDDRAPEDYMTNPDDQLVIGIGDLLTHEFSHSWTGKYRRPWDHATANFQIPQRTNLLWVYEGLNQYVGDVLSFRIGIRKSADYPSFLAMIYARMAGEPGRNTDPLIDTATAAPFLYNAGASSYPSIRRTANDFYWEGELLWLDVDTIIRERTAGKRSLENFLQLYTAPSVTGPITKTYTGGDIERLLSEVVPYDWHGFFRTHVYELSPLPPTDMINRAGWELVYTSEPNEFIKAWETVGNVDYQWLSYGLLIGQDNIVSDVREGSPAWMAGMSVGMKLMALDGQAYTKKVLQYVTVQAERTTGTTKFLVQQDGWYRTVEVDYHGGPKYPHLVPIRGKPDILAEITAPHTSP